MPSLLETDDGKEYVNKNFNEFLNNNNNKRYSRYHDKGAAFPERFKRTLRNFLKKPVFEKGKADWLPELSSVLKQYNSTIHHSIKMSPIQASKKANEKMVHNSLKDNREIQKPKFKLGQLIRTADIKRVFRKGDSTNYSNKLYTVREIIHYTIPSYRIDYLPERYNENLLLPTKLSFEQNNQFLKKLNLIA